ncbi:hydroxymethylglutaryl-CoA lyase [Litorivivens lipolytica]|uniref:Hydroxymethylglutaryl-CoA lyase n=1 Tax=Litorivivens lipolytica TaxID=1524264 RepID=A0A7W4W5S0_9GAMM|nr:hydroxymethylglutaryl-CoA lyase [Litorivivens lipolytica]MBB3047996.1 hydroxymethylglutaryl-CoA lyase [Litorivivens lipolytica]
MTNIDIEISEVGPRDGLQSIKTIMSTEDKKAWIAAEAAAGVPEIEVGSFVPPSVIPQLADTAEVVAYARTIPGLAVAALVPNLRGAENAIAAGAHKISIPLSVSETHSLKNVKRSHVQMLEEIDLIVQRIRELPEGERPKFEVGLSTAFGCTIEGPVSEDLVVQLAVKAVALGVDEVGLSDTTGYGNPAQLKRLTKRIWENCGREKLNGVHLHNTRGQGLANALAAVDIGLTTIDSSLGGIGGCPFAPGASGNIVTEDLVFMLEAMGLKTGIDIEKLLAVRELVQKALPEEEMYGFTPEAGLPKGFVAATGS